MTKSTYFTCGLSVNLHLITDAYFRLLEAQSSFSSLSKSNHQFSTRYLGSELNAVLSAYVKSHCVKLKNSLKEDTKAEINAEKALNILIKDGYLPFDEYDRTVKNEEDAKKAIDAFVSNCDFNAFLAFTENEKNKLKQVGLAISADNIINRMGLHTGITQTGKKISITAKSVSTFGDNTARWTLKDVCWRNDLFAREIHELANDIAIACQEMQMVDLSGALKNLALASEALGVYERLPKGNLYKGPLGTSVKAYHGHFKTTFSRDGFNTLMAFLCLYKSDSVALNNEAFNI